MHNLLLRLLAILVLSCLHASPLVAQRAIEMRVGAEPTAKIPVALPPLLLAEPSAVARFAPEDDGALAPWARRALIGGGIGALGGWLLSGLPCENAPSNCPSPLQSVLAGAAIGALLGVIWNTRPQWP